MTFGGALRQHFGGAAPAPAYEHDPTVYGVTTDVPDVPDVAEKQREAQAQIQPASIPPPAYTKTAPAAEGVPAPREQPIVDEERFMYNQDPGALAAEANPDPNTLSQSLTTLHITLSNLLSKESGLNKHETKREAKHAVKQLVRDVWAAEQAKRGGGRGRGCCGAIPMSHAEKRALKVQVREVKRDVKGLVRERLRA